tara:strand:- start:422 stop:562 length:141 start_codon:yes stop_codon:yes gene_type:complete
MAASSKDPMKFQEWIVMFDGKIKQSETLINSKEYHQNIKVDSKDEL